VIFGDGIVSLGEHVISLRKGGFLSKLAIYWVLKMF